MRYIRVSWGNIMGYLIASEGIGIFSIFAWGFIGGIAFATLVTLIFNWIKSKDEQHDAQQIIAEYLEEHKELYLRSISHPAEKENHA